MMMAHVTPFAETPIRPQQCAQLSPFDWPRGSRLGLGPRRIATMRGCGALALLASLPAVLSSYGPRAGPGTTVVWPSGLPPTAPSHDIQPYVTGISAWNGNTYAIGPAPFNYSLMPYNYTSSCVGWGQTQHWRTGAGAVVVFQTDNVHSNHALAAGLCLTRCTSS